MYTHHTKQQISIIVCNNNMTSQTAELSIVQGYNTFEYGIMNIQQPLKCTSEYTYHRYHTKTIFVNNQFTVHKKIQICSSEINRIVVFKWQKNMSKNSASTTISWSDSNNVCLYQIDVSLPLFPELDSLQNQMNIVEGPIEYIFVNPYISCLFKDNLQSILFGYLI